MKTLFKSTIFSSLLFLVVFVTPVYGAIDSAQELTVFIFSTVNSLIRIVMILGLVFFFWGTSLFILHSADEEKREDGKKKMLWGIITLAVMFGVWGIIRVLQSFILGSFMQVPPTF